LLFAGLEYYPSGGVHDFIKDFDTLEEAQISKPFEDINWQNILDLETGEMYEWHNSIHYNDRNVWLKIEE